MHIHSEEVHHTGHFSADRVMKNVKTTTIIIILTILTMGVEILFGNLTNSMALLADGFHMGTHALALGVTLLAYLLMKKFEHSGLFQNGTDKIAELGGYTSAVLLGLTGVYVLCEALNRFIHPVDISFNEAILVALIGLIVNGFCIFIMERGHHKESEDNNFKAAYFHILSDALTSILAIVALLAGKYFSLLQTDSLIGILGGVLILKWSCGLISDTVKHLVDFKEL